MGRAICPQPLGHSEHDLAQAVRPCLRGPGVARCRPAGSRWRCARRRASICPFPTGTLGIAPSSTARGHVRIPGLAATSPLGAPEPCTGAHASSCERDHCRRIGRSTAWCRAWGTRRATGIYPRHGPLGGLVDLGEGWRVLLGEDAAVLCAWQGWVRRRASVHAGRSWHMPFADSSCWRARAGWAASCGARSVEPPQCALSS